MGGVCGLLSVEDGDGVGGEVCGGGGKTGDGEGGDKEGFTYTPPKVGRPRGVVAEV